MKLLSFLFDFFRKLTNNSSNSSLRGSPQTTSCPENGSHSEGNFLSEVNMNSKYFTWKEMTYLPQWKRQATEEELTPETKENLKTLMEKMDLVREYFNSPIIVHVAFRTPEYNKLVKGAKNSTHLYGMACDFHIKGITCDAARARIIKDNKLEEWGMRMEKLPGSNWVHLDYRAPGPSGRYFPV